MEKNEHGHYQPMNVIELLDLIRIRHQMYASNVDMLAGILTGFSISKIESDESFDGFQSFLARKMKLNPQLYSWMEMIQMSVSDEDYEVSVFYKLWDEFREIKREALAHVKLSWEQRRFDFDRVVKIQNIDKRELPLKAPHQIRVVKFFDNRILALYFDEKNTLYYEKSLKDIEYLYKWAKDCFDIPKEAWVQINIDNNETKETSK